jgi:hypothetical protein
MRRLLRSLAVTYILSNSMVIELDFTYETEFVKRIPHKTETFISPSSNQNELATSSVKIK